MDFMSLPPGLVQMRLQVAARQETGPRVHERANAVPHGDLEVIATHARLLVVTALGGEGEAGVAVDLRRAPGPHAGLGRFVPRDRVGLDVQLLQLIPVPQLPDWRRA